MRAGRDARGVCYECGGDHSIDTCPDFKQRKAKLDEFEHKKATQGSQSALVAEVQVTPLSSMPPAPDPMVVWGADH